MQEQKHIPVMLKEVLENLKPADDKVYVDATFGNGGYTKAILDSAKCKVISIDRDPNVLPRAKEFKNEYGTRFDFVPGRFGDLENLITEKIDGIVFDIGVSSMQLDQSDRGFSFSKTASLDMRMSCEGLSAGDIVNDMEEKELADLIYKYGEEVKSRHIASRIIEKRKEKKIQTTTELADIIRSVVRRGKKDIDPATKTFQALRIAVNNELGELEEGLASAVKLLKEEGRLVVVTFHSLEDRIVKNFLRQKSGNTPNVSRYMPEVIRKEEVELSTVSKAIKPSKQEEGDNKRARSAKLRYGIK